MTTRPFHLRSRTRLPLLAAASALTISLAGAAAEIKTVTAHDPDGASGFRLENTPSPARKDAASDATFTLLEGDADSNCGGLQQLHDGVIPNDADEPEHNFFFAAGTPGGRIFVDLKRVTDIKQINTYSWHPTTRGPQRYKLYASDGTSAQFTDHPAKNTPLEKAGWIRLAEIDTRSKGGGQHAVSISDSGGTIGKYRYLLFDISQTEDDDAFGNTFYSEFDVVEVGAPQESAVAEAPFTIKSADNSCDISIDTSAAPDLKDWAEQKLGPALAEWYPKLVAMLPSDGFVAPIRYSIVIKPMDGVAFAAGKRISANSRWLSRELNGEAIGALIHETVHVIQLPGAGYRNRSDGTRAPDWLVEGIPDYIRFYKYEPQTHGADLIWLKARPNIVLNYDARYRTTANFLNYVVENHDPAKTLIAKINAACREQRYTDGLWKEFTGKTLAELNDEWKTATRQQLGTKSESGNNTLSSAEEAAGWKRLFNGVDLTGWRNFKSDSIRPGWQVRDGSLVCVDPKNAGDIVTEEKFGAFELELEYNISEGGNSGIIFHVTDEGGAVWATGPELQLEDNSKAADAQRCGWLYALYQPPTDPKTGKPIDATKPAGEWNQVRLVISPEKCEHFINGVKYFEYILGSEDFNRRVAASKFSKMPRFAKSDMGYIALQGDHGQISFRNIRIRSLPVASAATVSPTK